jgi:hypothetical protein
MHGKGMGLLVRTSVPRAGVLFAEAVRAGLINNNICLHPQSV